LTNRPPVAYPAVGMGKVVNIYEAKTHLSKLVDEAAAGSEIVIAKAGVPRARLVSVERARQSRKPGGAKGGIRIARDFDDPLPLDILKAFLGGS
jgi:prevent-host-death family protein